MPEFQAAVVGFNIAGLDPIEVAHSSAGTTVDLSADATAYGKMHVMSGTGGNYTCIFPTAVGHEGETIGFRGSSAMTATVTLDGSGSETLDTLATMRLVANESRLFRATSGNWVTEVSNPLTFGRSVLSAASNASQAASSGIPTKLAANTIDSPTNKLDGGGWYNTSTQTYSPTLSGYYIFSVVAQTAPATANNQWTIAYLYKNGSLYKGGSIVVVPLNFGMAASIVTLAYATPSDSFQPWAVTTQGAFSVSSFQAAYLGGV